jgi:hypothetical protein
MKKETILGIVRHTLTFVGGILVTKGFIGEEIMLEVVGGVMTLVGTIWSILKK